VAQAAECLLYKHKVFFEFKPLPQSHQKKKKLKPEHIMAAT
jgi:hypothetical protein